MISRLISFLLVFVLPLSGCGYALVGSGSSLPANVRTVSIPLFENKTGEPNLDTIVTRVVKEKFIEDGRLKVLDGAMADSVLRGVIESYSLKPLAYDESNNVTEYMVRMTIYITHTAGRSGKILKRQRLNTNWRYAVDPSITVAESQRLDAMEKAAVYSAESIISLVIESF